jgi:hypothetical protein
MGRVPIMAQPKAGHMIGASMIGENLCRAELSPADCAQQRVRRKAIDEELHPEMRHGVIGNGREKSRQVGDSSKNVVRFIADTAARVGKGERDAERNGQERALGT